MKKLPTIDAQYWALILSATTLGETAGDLISMSLNLGYALGSIALVSLFIVALAVELNAQVKSAFLYWLVVVLASTSGTTISDFVTRSLKLGYGWGSLLMISILALIFIVWRLSAPSISINGQLTFKTRALYWSAILVSSTLGTAFGDFLANGTSLGFGGGTFLLAGCLLLVGLAAGLTPIPKSLCYWMAIVITHPIGATMGDYLTKPQGLHLGNVWSSLLLLCIFAFIAIISRFSASSVRMAG
ncbi:hypothetical protein EON80_08020 [bacterium]|nr:MAG: hypothetical protein EON80_08020 [bacterium]